MATAEKRVVTDATGQAMLAELRKIPGVMNPVPVEKGGTGVTTPQEILELIGAQPKFDFNVEEQLNAAVKSVNEIKPDAQGNVQIMRVPMADNFTSDEAQVVSGAFIERTTGGDASISDGTATLGVLYGNSIRSGYTAESKNMEVQLAGRFDDSIPLSATISWDAYKAAVNYISTNKTFTYTSNWNENPETYGITLSGTPVSGDVINVYYIAENRGTIANATPTSFVQTNWNLYDFEKGYARVLKYSDEHGFKIGGYYTGVSFATTVEGDKTVITPDSDGFFDVPSDGYVFVAGGNNTDTYVLMTWSDWHDGYTGDYLTYAESVIDFSELMGNVFPFGMCAIGITMDEINFNDKTAIVRIERVAYTTENRILVEQSGRAYAYDADWIYSVKETPDRVRFNIENDLVVYDHGTEFFTGTEVPVLAYELFGQNLKDKLRREVVAVTPQNFSASQKAQARENIEAAWNSEVIKSINNKVPDANGNITIVEGQSNASYGSYRIDPVIPPAAWTLVNGQYQVAYFDPLIKATMTGAETWLDDSDVMLGATHFNTVDGALMIVTEVQPTDTWRLHVLLAENGATVLEEVNNKAEESTVAIVETGDTAFHAITAGQYVMWNGVLYKALRNISAGAALVATGSNANLSAVTGGIGNDLFDKFGYETVSDWNDFKPLATDRSPIKKYGISVGNSQGANAPFSGDNTTWYGYVEGYPSYCTQHLTSQYSATSKNRDRHFIRSYIANAWTDWQELLRKSDNFKIGGNSNPSDVNNTELFGTYFARGSECANLPTSDLKYYSIACFGVYQIAAMHSTEGLREVYSRHYINSKWYPWQNYKGIGGWLDANVDLDTITAPGMYGIDGLKSYTNLPIGCTYGILEVIAPSTNYTYGIQRIHQGSRIFERYRSGSSGASYAAWYEFSAIPDAEKVNKKYFEALPANSNKVLTVANNTRAIVFVIGATEGAWIISTNAGGTITMLELAKHSNISATASGNKLTLTNNSSYNPDIYVLVLAGSLSV